MELERVLGFIGGVKTRGSWSFPYEPTVTLDTIVSTGLIPEIKSHQFYPTPEVISKYVAQILDCQPGDKVLEPSAGRGDLLSHIELPAEDITCVEISPLFSDILKAKGYQVHNKDFIAWSGSSDNPGGFNKIAANPPFSEGRAKEHVLEALKSLAKSGIMVAILPAGYKPDEWIGNEFICAKSGRDFIGEFR